VTRFRRQVELKAGPLVILLARLPRAVPFLVVAGLLIGGLLAQGLVGAVLLLLLALLLGSLLFLSWPALQPPPRVLRSLVLAILVFRAATFLS
jgi:hypothetical protein